MTDSIKVALRQAEAAYANSLGYFRIDENNKLVDIQLVFPNTGNVSLGTEATLDGIRPNDHYGFFILPDGFNQNAALADVHGKFALVDSVTGAAASLDGNHPLDLTHTTIDGATTTLQGPVFLSVDPSSSFDAGALHIGGQTQAQVEDLADGRYSVAFEDLTRGSGTSDDDFDDVVFTVRPSDETAVSSSLSSDSYEQGWDDSVYSMVSAVNFFGEPDQNYVVFSTPTGIHSQAWDSSAGKFSDSVYHVVDGIDGNGDHSTFYRYVHVMDLNEDGNDDLIALRNSNDPGQPVIDVMMGTSTIGDYAGFHNPVSYTLNVDHSSDHTGQTYSLDDITFGDVNKDGHIDVLVSGMTQYSKTTSPGDDENPPTTTTFASGILAIGLGTGSGGFNFASTAQETYASSSGSDAIGFIENVISRVTAADFNKDGYLDVALAYHTSATFVSNANVEVVFGDSGLTDGTPSYDFTNNLVDTGHTGPQDVLAVDSRHGSLFPNIFDAHGIGGLGDEADFFLAVATDSSSHMIRFNTDRTIASDTDIEGTPRGPMGDAGDLNDDDQADIQYLDGDSSVILDGYNWNDPSNSSTQTPDYKLGDDLQTGAFGYFNGDAKLDWVGTHDNNLYHYINVT